MTVKELMELIIPEQRLDVYFLNEIDHFILYDDALNKEVTKISSQPVIYQKGINKVVMRIAINIYVKDNQ